jgi:hypothetical protein
MLVPAKTASSTSNPSTLHLQLQLRKHTTPSGKSTSEESGPTYESVASVFDREISRFLRKLDRVDMDRSSLPRRRIRERSVR